MAPLLLEAPIPALPQAQASRRVAPAHPTRSSLKAGPGPAGGMHELLRHRAGFYPHGCLRGPGEPPVLSARRPEEPLAVRQFQGDGRWLPPTPRHLHT